MAIGLVFEISRTVLFHNNPCIFRQQFCFDWVRLAGILYLKDEKVVPSSSGGPRDISKSNKNKSIHLFTVSTNAFCLFHILPVRFDCASIICCLGR